MGRPVREGEAEAYAIGSMGGGVFGATEKGPPARAPRVGLAAPERRLTAPEIEAIFAQADADLAATTTEEPPAAPPTEPPPPSPVSLEAPIVSPPGPIVSPAAPTVPVEPPIVSPPPPTTPPAKTATATLPPGEMPPAAPTGAAPPVAPAKLAAPPKAEPAAPAAPPKAAVPVALGQAPALQLSPQTTATTPPPSGKIWLHNPTPEEIRAVEAQGYELTSEMEGGDFIFEPRQNITLVEDTPRPTPPASTLSAPPVAPAKLATPPKAAVPVAPARRPSMPPVNSTITVGGIDRDSGPARQIPQPRFGEHPGPAQFHHAGTECEAAGHQSQGRQQQDGPNRPRPLPEGLAHGRLSPHCRVGPRGHPALCQEVTRRPNPRCRVGRTRAGGRSASGRGRGTGAGGRDCPPGVHGGFQSRQCGPPDAAGGPRPDQGQPRRVPRPAGHRRGAARHSGGAGGDDCRRRGRDRGTATRGPGRRRGMGPRV